jgi:hypothetical protein
LEADEEGESEDPATDNSLRSVPELARGGQAHSPDHCPARAHARDGEAMSIRDIVRRERWEMNRGAYEAELMLLGAGDGTDTRDEGDGWTMVTESYVNVTLAERWRRMNEQLFG